MNRHVAAQATFDRDAYERAYAEVVQITGQLPVRAVRTLAQEVVSRLSARRALGTLAERRPRPELEEIMALSRALVSDDPDAWVGHLAEPREDGLPLEDIYHDYLAAAARQLGEWWDDDRMSFAEVSVGVGRIYAIMRSLRPGAAPPRDPQNMHAVFAAVPEETHTLGVTMAADVFRTHGWTIELQIGKSHDELVEALAEQDCSFIGLSASARRFTTPLIRLIVALRLVRPESLILVSGKIVDLERNIAGVTGADVATTDIDEALAELQRLWDTAQQASA